MLHTTPVYTHVWGNGAYVFNLMDINHPLSKSSFREDNFDSNLDLQNVETLFILANEN